MDDLYTLDVAAWAERQADLLRRLGAASRSTTNLTGRILRRKSRTWQPAKGAKFATGSLCCANIS
jgi:hypothetical protein